MTEKRTKKMHPMIAGWSGLVRRKRLRRRSASNSDGVFGRQRGRVGSRPVCTNRML